MTTVKFSADVLNRALTELADLSSLITSSASGARGSVPWQVSLPSLYETGTVGTVSTWLDEQAKDPITVVRDLALLLDSDGGEVSFTSNSGDVIADVKRELGRLVANELDDINDMRSPEDRKRIAGYVALASTYASDPDFAESLIEKLGPEGLSSVLHQAKHLTSASSEYLDQINLDQYGAVSGEEDPLIRALQDDLADALAESLATASSADRLDPDFGTQLVEKGSPLAAGILMRYADKGNYHLSEKLLLDVGTSLLDVEHNDPAVWSSIDFEPGNGFGSIGAEDLKDQVVNWLGAVSDNDDASQTVLLDEAMAPYLLERGRDNGDAIGRVLQSATVDQAFSTDSHGEKAADISAWILQYYGGDREPLDGIKEELGGIIATYMSDVDRVTTRADDDTFGTYKAPHDRLPPWLDPGSVPPWGLNLDREGLGNILHDIGDNEAAASVIGETATAYNQVRLDHGAERALLGVSEDGDFTAQSDGDPLMAAANSSSQLQGWLIDNLVAGHIATEESDIAKRERIAELFSLPQGYVKKVPIVGSMLNKALTDPIGGYIFGQIKQQVTDEYVSDGLSQVISEGNKTWGSSRTSLHVQALYSLLHAQTSTSANPTASQQPDGTYHFDISEGLIDAWPGASTGNPISPGSLSDDQLRAILDESTQSTGYSRSVGTTIDQSFDNLVKHFGDE